MKKRNQILATLSDKQLIRKGDRAVRNRHELAIEILDCLIEVERRSLYLEEGYSSLFDFCTRRWHYSPPKAGRTIATARCVKNFPAVRSLLIERKITVCGVARIAGILTDKNYENLLREVSGKRYDEIDKIAASLRTAPAIREFVRPIGRKAASSREKGAGDENLFRATEEAAAGMADRTANRYRFDSKWQVDHAPVSETGPAPRPDLDENRTESRYEIRFSASERFLKKLERAKTICSRRPGLEAVLEKALDELLERHDPERKEARREKRKSARRDRSEPVPTNVPLSGEAPPESNKVGDSSRPNHAPVKRSGSSLPSRVEKTSRRSRHIPAETRDAVFSRDHGRCTYIGKNGVRCETTVHLQIDHIRPFCLGGEHTLDNLRVRCGKHNRLVARKLALHSRISH